MSLLKEKEGKNLNGFNKQLNDILSKTFQTMIQKVVDETIGDGNPSSNEGNIKPKKK